MSQLQPGQGEFLLHGVYLPDLCSEHPITKTVIEAIPLDKSDFRLDGISKSALDLAWHIVISEMRFMDAPITGTFDVSPRPRPETVVNSHDLGAWYADMVAGRVEKLKTLADEPLRQIIDFRGLFRMPAVSYLGFMLRHSIHHRGQLSAYLRPMGAKVPAIYGESYDSAEAKKAAAGGA